MNHSLDSIIESRKQADSKEDAEKKYGAGELGMAAGTAGMVQQSFSNSKKKPHAAAVLAGAGAIKAGYDHLAKEETEYQSRLKKVAKGNPEKKELAPSQDNEDISASKIGVTAGTGLVGAGATMSAVKKEQGKQKKLDGKYDNKIKNIETKLKKAKGSKTGGWGEEEFDALKEKSDEYKHKAESLSRLRKEKIKILSLKGGLGTLSGATLVNNLFSDNNVDSRVQ